MHNGFKGKVGIVTGAASGIGLAIARKLSSYNVRLSLFDINKDLLLKLQPEFPEYTKFSVIDITNEIEIQEAIEGTIGHFGSIDILVK
jgi:NADP-dependent 3-hydroxy acid dehydrogenase YdfG